MSTDKKIPEGVRELINLHQEKLKAARDSTGRNRTGRGHAVYDRSTSGDGHPKDHERKCSGCEKRGHVKADCPEKKRSAAKSGDGSAAEKRKQVGKTKDTKATCAQVDDSLNMKSKEASGSLGDAFANDGHGVSVSYGIVPVGTMAQPQLWYFT